MKSYWSLANGVFVFYKDFCGGGAGTSRRRKKQKRGLVFVLENLPHQTLQNSVPRDWILRDECPIDITLTICYPMLQQAPLHTVIYT